MPAVKEITDGTWSANIDTAGKDDALVGADSVSPGCAADHTAVGAARPAADSTVVVAAAGSSCHTTAADDKGLTDVHQAAYAAAAAGQVQAGVQLDDREHGDAENGEDAELHNNAATGWACCARYACRSTWQHMITFASIFATLYLCCIMCFNICVSIFCQGQHGHSAAQACAVGVPALLCLGINHIHSQTEPCFITLSLFCF